MTFDTVVWFENIDGSAALVNLLAVVDEHIAHAADDITVPEANKIIGALAFGLGMTHARIYSPSLERKLLLELPKFNALDTLKVSKGQFNDFSDNPIEMVEGELMRALIQNGAANDAYVLLWIAKDKPVKQDGERIYLRGTFTTVTPAELWANVAMTWGQNLKAGRYAIVGMHCQVATEGVALRAVFREQAERPACIVKILHDGEVSDVFENGNWGNWGEFEFNQIPVLQLFGDGASGAGIVTLELIQVREGA